PLLLQLLWIGAAAAGHWEVALLGAGGVFVASLGLAWLVHADFRQRLLRITENADRLARRQPLLPPHENADEIGQLDRAFHAMAQTLGRADEAMRLSTEELRDLYHNAPCGYHSIGPDGALLAVND